MVISLNNAKKQSVSLVLHRDLISSTNESMLAFRRHSPAAYVCLVYQGHSGNIQHSTTVFPKEQCSVNAVTSFIWNILLSTI